MVLPTQFDLRSPGLAPQLAGSIGMAEEPRRPEGLPAPVRSNGSKHAGGNPGNYLPGGGEGNVRAVLSPALRELLAAGVDVGDSRTSVTRDSANFHLEFKSASTERLTADGYYAVAAKSLNVSYAYRFQQVVRENGQDTLRTYEVQLNLQVDHYSETAVEPVTAKEDILSLVRGLLQDISKLVVDDEKDLGGVILNRKDLLDLLSIDDGRLAKKLNALVQVTVALARLRYQLKGDRDLVTLWPQREEKKGIKVTSLERRVSQFSLAIREVQADSPVASSPVETESPPAIAR